jgi:hypothetical protein
MAGVGRKSRAYYSTHYSSCVDDLVQNVFAGTNYRVLTVGRVEIECSPVPPGEAAHFILAAPICRAARELEP